MCMCMIVLKINPFNDQHFKMHETDVIFGYRFELFSPMVGGGVFDFCFSWWKKYVSITIQRRKYNGCINIMRVNV